MTSVSHLNQTRASFRTFVSILALVWSFQFITEIGISFRYDFNPLLIPPFLLLILALINSAWTTGILYYFLCKKPNLSFAQGFKFNRLFRRQWIFYGILGLLLALLASWVHAHFGSGTSDLVKITSTRAGMIFVVAIALFMPVVEELYYRGFVFPYLSSWLHPVLAIFITTFWFALPHYSQLAGDRVGFILVIFLGLVLTAVRYWSRSLTPSLIVHWVYNGLVVILAVADTMSK